MAAIYRNYGDFQTPTPIAIGSRAFPNWGSTFAGDLGALVKQAPFRRAVLERSFETFAWLNSGALVRNTAIDLTTGHQVELPMIRPFIAEKEYVESNTTWGASGKGHLTVQKMNADSAFMPIQQFGFAAGADDLSAWMSGLDPLGIMESYVAENVQRHTLESMMAVLDGFFKTGGLLATSHTLDVTAASSPTEANFLSAANLMRAKSLLGARGERLQIAAMHPNVAYYLSTLGMLTFSTSALATGGNIAWGGGGVGITNTQVANMAGFRVVVDEKLTPEGTGATAKYPVYLMEPGSLSWGVRNGFRIRYDTNILSFQNVFAVDWSGAIGVPGLSWKGSMTFPKDSDLATPANWETKITDTKNVGIVKLLVNNAW